MSNRTFLKHTSLLLCMSLCNVALIASYNDVVADDDDSEMPGRPTPPTPSGGQATNTKTGNKALHLNKTGLKNTANGYKALYLNKKGDKNVAVGYQAGADVTGDNNINIGSDVSSAKNASNEIRIGKNSHTACYVGGIYGVDAADGSKAVYVGADGKLAVGSADVAVAGDLDVAGDGTVGGDLTVTGNGTMSADLTVTGSLKFPTRQRGVVEIAGSRFIHSYGTGDTFVGKEAGNFSMSGSWNTGTGYLALTANTTGFENTASGFAALRNNTTGDSNTAVGAEALRTNTTGVYNTATGFSALYANNADKNSATGFDALYNNTSGTENSAFGYAALYANTTGGRNSAIGSSALDSVTSGGYNSALGYNAGTAITTGSNNTTLGYNAGSALTTGSNNIDIGNVGVAGESGIIRIGTDGTHTDCYLAGQVHIGSSSRVFGEKTGIMLDATGTYTALTITGNGALPKSIFMTLCYTSTDQGSGFAYVRNVALINGVVVAMDLDMDSAAGSTFLRVTTSGNTITLCHDNDSVTPRAVYGDLYFDIMSSEIDTIA